jgi:hypothetical protein
MQDDDEQDRRAGNRRSSPERRESERRCGDDTRPMIFRFLFGDRRWRLRRSGWDRRRVLDRREGKRPAYEDG